MQRKTIGLRDELYDYVVATTHADDDILARLRDETSTMEQSGMQIAPEQGQFMALMARLIGARRVIEVGVFTGYSSLCVARALGEEGHLVACDVNEDWTAIARRYWEAAEVDQRIDLRLAPATDTLEGLIADGQAATFDMAFIDADKVNYVSYYHHLVELTRPGGLVVLDNALWSGRVLNPEEPSDHALAEMNRVVRDDPKVHNLLMPMRDGLMVAQKLN